mmetsp:Transcript_3428/g.6011  ORF Transcript_3428/g.6011 Transcript_3428/m.6011 type:complete len:226 (-) Transcript_3428:473-1150(-)
MLGNEAHLQVELLAGHLLTLGPKHGLSLLMCQWLALQHPYWSPVLRCVMLSSRTSFPQGAKQLSRFCFGATGLSEDSHCCVLLGLEKEEVYHAAKALRSTLEILRAAGAHGALHQLSWRNTGMRAKGLDLRPFLLQALVQSICEYNIRKLALLIPDEVSAFEKLRATSSQISSVLLQILGFKFVCELRPIHDTRSARVIHDARLSVQTASLLQQRHTQIGEQEMG